MDHKKPACLGAGYVIDIVCEDLVTAPILQNAYTLPASISGPKTATSTNHNGRL